MRRLRFVVSGMLLIFGMLLASAASADAPPIKADDVTAEATSAAGASVTYHVRAYDSSTPSSPIPIAATCNPPGSGGAGDFDVTADFPLGDTSVTCTTTEPEYSTTFTVHVVDTTAPSIPQHDPIATSTTDPNGTTVSWDPITATDAVDGSIPTSCSPQSGSTFSIGPPHTVTCSAEDSHHNPASMQFTVTVSLDDTQAPTFTSVPEPITKEATGPNGAVATFPTPAATDNAGEPTVACTPGSGSTFPLGVTTVTCTATDRNGNHTETSFTVTVEDTTPPVLSLPGDQTIEAESPAGANVPYSASASDTVAGAVSPGCSPASGSLFPVGTTPVTCNTNDGRGNTASGAFNVTVVLVDHTAPTFAGVPATIQREANGPLGSSATYTPPTATDNLDGGPLLVTCLPASGATFPVGTTTVTCHATDSHGNVGTATFSVQVVDTTKPVLTPPGDRNIYATTPTGIPRDDPNVNSFLTGGTASDIVDETLFIGNNAPEFFPVGATIVRFATTDDSGNTATATATLTVFPMPAPGTNPAPLPQPPDRSPPDDVKDLQAKPASRKVTLTWRKPAAADFDHVTITRSLADGTATGVVYTGKATSYVDTSLQNGVEYRYTVVAFDIDGNRSAGVVVAAVPKQLLLLTPRDGARVKSTKKTLKLSWARMVGADYYNVQLYFVPDLKTLGLQPASAQAEVKVLTVWPKKNSFVLKKTWKFSGVRYRLRPGLYRWYVWPGFGARAAVDYGPLMGSSTFLVVR